MTHGEPPTFYDDLDASLEEAWRMLEAAVDDRTAPFHVPTLATLSRDDTPNARSVVLRRVERAERWVQVHTDRRAGKVAEVMMEPRVSLHFYDPQAKIQLRCAGIASAHSIDMIAEDAWQRSQDFSRTCYRLEPGPGTPLKHPGEAVMPESDDPDAGREHFSVLRIEFRALEWLYLAAQGHRRARFAWRPEGLRATWLSP